MVTYLFYLTVIILGIVAIFSYRSGQMNDFLFIPLISLAIILFIMHLINKKKQRTK